MLHNFGKGLLLLWFLLPTLTVKLSFSREGFELWAVAVSKELERHLRH
jgi:hypothetical protein